MGFCDILGLLVQIRFQINCQEFDIEDQTLMYIINIDNIMKATQHPIFKNVHDKNEIIGKTILQMIKNGNNTELFSLERL